MSGSAGLSGALAALGVDESRANDGGWVAVACPACSSEGSSASLRVNVNSGSYRCYRCGAESSDGGATLAAFVADPRAPSLKPGTAASRADLPPLTEDLVATYAWHLQNSPGTMQDIQRRRGWRDDTINALKLGWDGSYLWIPIYDPAGKLVNARMYDPFKRNAVKSFHYANPDGLIRTTAWAPFGAASLKDSEWIWLFEGEPDGILAAQTGLPTVVITGGAGTWTDVVLEIVKGKKIALCYDIDEAGQRGARKILSRLDALGYEAYIVKFTVSDPSTMKDFTDAVQKDNRDISYFLDRLKDSVDGKVTDVAESPAIPVKLGLGSPGDDLVTKAHVLGTNQTPRLIPAVAEVSCDMSWDDDKCKKCTMMHHSGRLRIDIDPESKTVLHIANSPERMHDGILKRLGRIPTKCPIVDVKAVESHQIQTMKLVPPMADRHGGDSTIRSAVHVIPADGRGPAIRANQLYTFRGKIIPDTETNEWTFVTADARPAEDDVEAFRMDDALEQSLRQFNPVEWTAEAVRGCVNDEVKRLSRHVTRIFGREELLEALDLCYHSVLNIKFGGQLRRGWLSLGVFGDTRTGKSETMYSFSSHIGLGKYVMDPANMTYAGLVGGLQQVGTGDKSWTITWGLVPTNDRGMVIIDEVSSLAVDDIGRMSGMRSSGLAEITKIRSASTPARTRMVMSGNPRGVGKTLSSFGTPVEGFAELIGAPEDVARFDMAIAVKGGLDKRQADMELGEQPQPVATVDRRNLVRYAWSRTPDQVSWDNGVEEFCTDAGADMATRYSSTVPLVEPAEQDQKIARIAVAAAVRTFSVADDDPNVVRVRRCHVEYAVDALDRFYRGDIGYASHSEFLARQQMDPGAARSVLEQAGRGLGSARALLSVRRVTVNSIGLAVGLEPADAREFIASMISIGAAKFDHGDRANATAVWTAEFLAVLRSIELEDLPTEDLLASDPF